jgi:hypothetical protein
VFFLFIYLFGIKFLFFKKRFVLLLPVFEPLISHQRSSGHLLLAVSEVTFIFYKAAAATK